jgi:hypothetical protein
MRFFPILFSQIKKWLGITYILQKFVEWYREKIKHLLLNLWLELYFLIPD